MRITKEQPVFARRVVGGALLHKGAERRDAGARANHDHRGFRVSRQAEVVVVLDKDPHLALLFHAIREEARSATGAGAAFDVVAHHAHGDVDFALYLGLGRGDRVQARRQRTQQANQRDSIQLCRSKTHHIDDWRGSGILLQFGFVTHQRQQGFAAGQGGIVFHDVRGVDGQLEMPLQRFRERQGFAVDADRLIALQPQQFNQLFHQRRIVLIPDAKRIARLIAQAGVA